MRVEGTVQGVGFRPFVYSLASRLGLGRGGRQRCGRRVRRGGGSARSRSEISPGPSVRGAAAGKDRARQTRQIPPNGSDSFTIAESEAGGPRRTLVSADSATCADCLAELADPADRRFGYPFINCTNCGPRFTIVTGVPYDRPLTTMAGFAMCAQCAAEYHDPADRRFHAQPTCCPACGPALWLADAPAAAAPPGDPLAGAAELIRDGGVLALKGLGGWHLAVDASCQQAAAALRGRKHREDKPFAVMAADLAAARRLCELDETEAALLASRRRPIVLAAPAAGRTGRGRGGAGEPAAGDHAPVHAAASPAARRGGPPDGADQRQHLRRADRLPGRGRAGPAGRHRRRLLGHDRPSTSGPTTRWCGRCAAGKCCCGGPAATRRSR